MEYLLKVKISALAGLLVLTLFFGFIPVRMKFFRKTSGTGKSELIICAEISLSMCPVYMESMICPEL